jgi:hypothetical protein
MRKMCTVVAALALLVVAAAGQWAWSVQLEPTDMFSSISLIYDDMYMVNSLFHLYCINMTNSTLQWRTRPAHMITLGNMVGSRMSNSVIIPTFANISNHSVYFLESYSLSNGNLNWERQLLQQAMSLDADGQVVLARSVANSNLTVNITVFESEGGMPLWWVPEGPYSTTPATVDRGVVISASIDLNHTVHHPDLKHLTVMEVKARDAVLGYLRWSMRCLLFIDQATKPKALGGVIAIANATQYSLWNFSVTIYVMPKTIDIPVGSITLPTNKLANAGAFSADGKRLYYTDMLSYVSAVALTETGLEPMWTANIWSGNPAFRPFVNTGDIIDAGPHMLLQINLLTTNPNATTAAQNISAYNATTGELCATVLIQNMTQTTFMPLMDGRLLVLPFYTPGFKVYSLSTGMVVREDTEAILVVGSVQLRTPGRVVMAFQNNTIAEVII